MDPRCSIRLRMRIRTLYLSRCLARHTVLHRGGQSGSQPALLPPTTDLPSRSRVVSWLATVPVPSRRCEGFVRFETGPGTQQRPFQRCQHCSRGREGRYSNMEKSERIYDTVRSYHTEQLWLRKSRNFRDCSFFIRTDITMRTRPSLFFGGMRSTVWASLSRSTRSRTKTGKAQ